MPLSKTKRYSNGNAKACGNGAKFIVSIDMMKLFQALANGDTPKAIAFEQGVTPQTIERHIRKYCKNIGAFTNCQALAILMRKGVVK